MQERVHGSWADDQLDSETDSGLMVTVFVRAMRLRAVGGLGAGRIVVIGGLVLRHGSGRAVRGRSGHV